MAPEIAKGYAKSKEKRDESAEKKRIEEAGKIIIQAQDAINKAEYRNYTTLQIFDTEGEQYLAELTEIWNSKAFMFFVDVHKNVVVSTIMNGDAKAAVEGQGILKGIDYLMKNIYSAKQKYEFLKETQAQ